MGIDIKDLPLYTAITATKCYSNDVAKIITLHNVHWYEGTKGYRQFIKAIHDTIEMYPGYMFYVYGICNYKGVIILEAIEKHIRKNKNIRNVKLDFGDYHANYRLLVNIKDK